MEKADELCQDSEKLQSEEAEKLECVEESISKVEEAETRHETTKQRVEELHEGQLPKKKKERP